MKPEGNRVGNCMGFDEKPQRLIGYKDEAKAKSFGCVLLESAEAKGTSEEIESESGTNL
jgi:hypothetical protein